MKRRNLFLSLLLAGACAIVGVGYSAITRELKIGGQLAGAKNDNSLKVEFQADPFSKVSAKGSAVIVATPTITNDHAANLDVSGMVDIGDKAEAYFLIKNESQPTKNLDATLAIPNVIVNNGSITADDDNTAANVFEGKHFKITAEYVTSVEGKPNATGTVDSGTAKLAAAVDREGTENDVDGQTVWVKVSVELIDVIIVDTFPTHNITVSFSASTVADPTPVQPQ